MNQAYHQLIAVFLTVFFSTFLLTFCQQNEPPLPDDAVQDGENIYLNTASSVQYTGSDACQQCHSDIHEQYFQTTTGRSMSKMDNSNVIESFPQTYEVYDARLKYFYEMIEKEGKYYQREYRLDDNGELIHERLMEAQYIIGSGKNLRMYFYNDNGMYYQLPLTWYVHRNRWDLSPGYKEFNNLRFSRYVGQLCFSCHNGYMELSDKSDNRYKSPIHLGVGCESCHGPGELHVAEYQNNTGQYSDDNIFTIVNPSKLSPQRRIDVCQQCHLEGDSWALNGHETWFDFRPGMLMSAHRSVYSVADVDKNAFKVANTAFRLLQSRCFTGSQSTMVCELCHDPHSAVKAPVVEVNRKNCMQCHPAETLPVNNTRYAHSVTDDCIPCHMNQTNTDQTLHGVINTDHWIRIDADKDTIDWTRLRTMTTRDPIVQLIPEVDIDDKGKQVRLGISYFTYWEDHAHQRVYLDSANIYINEGLKTAPDHAEGWYVLGKVYLEKNEFSKAVSALEKAADFNPDKGDIYFRLGIAYRLEKNLDKSIANFRKACQLLPDEPDYWHRLGNVLKTNGQLDEAVKAWKQSIAVDKQNPETFYNLGTYYAIQKNDFARAIPYFEKAVELDPTITAGLLNLGNSYLMTQNYEAAISAYRREIIFQPNAVSGYEMLGRVYIQQNRLDDAKAILTKGLQKTNSPRILSLLESL